jgi:hypothetical protein
MSEPSMVGSDLYLRHTSTSGDVDVRLHRVWDVDRFLTARQDECRDLNRKAKPGEPQKARVDMIDRATYDRERAPRG